MGPTERTREDILRLHLFLVSYLPLWVMLALRSLPNRLSVEWTGTIAWAPVVWAAVAALAGVDAARLLRGAQKKGAVHAAFVSVADEAGSAGTYLATYLLPLLAATPHRGGEWAAYAVFFVVLAITFVRSDLTLVNPTLYVAGRRIVSASPAEDRDGTLHAIEDAPRQIVVCRNAAALRHGGVEVVRLAGCWITKQEPDTTWRLPQWWRG